MKRDVAIRATHLPNAPKLFDVDDLLFGAILSVEDPVVPSTNQTFSPKVQVRAREYLAVLAPFLAPVSRDIVMLWTTPLMMATPNPRDPKLIPAWIEALMLAMAGAPTGAFSIENQRTALRTLTFFPSPADIWNIVSDDARRLRKRESTLRMIVGNQ